jgi:hypothetical protein
MTEEDLYTHHNKNNDDNNTQFGLANHKPRSIEKYLLTTTASTNDVQVIHTRKKLKKKKIH